MRCRNSLREFCGPRETAAASKELSVCSPRTSHVAEKYWRSVSRIHRKAGRERIPGRETRQRVSFRYSDLLGVSARFSTAHKARRLFSLSRHDLLGHASAEFKVD